MLHKPIEILPEPEVFQTLSPDSLPDQVLEWGILPKHVEKVVELIETTVASYPYGSDLIDVSPSFDVIFTAYCEADNRLPRFRAWLKTAVAATQAEIDSAQQDDYLPELEYYHGRIDANLLAVIRAHWQKIQDTDSLAKAST